jgi:MFS transporter, DHA1 family, multidrug resistance protein
MPLRPSSFAFTVLLGLLAAVPFASIDMSLPAVTATGAALGALPGQVGLTMSAFMLSLAAAPLVYGPLSDRYGRKPVAVSGVTLFVVGSLACALAPSLPALLIWRLFQGAGAAASSTLAMAIVRDLFQGQAARAKIANVVIAINVATVVAPTAGAALLAWGGWRSIYATQAVIGTVLLLALLAGFAESAKIDPANRLIPSVIARGYRRVLTHPICFGYILVGAAAGGTVFAYVTGSSLFFIDVVGLKPNQYGLIFSACSAAVMSGAFLDGRLGACGISPAHVLMTGLSLSASAATLLLAMTLAGWMPLAPVVALLIIVALAFGLSMPNMTNATMQPLPELAGAVSAAAGSVQMTAGAASGGLVSLLYDGRSALSMTAVMTLCSLAALVSYLLVARPAGRHGSAVEQIQASNSG